MSTELTLFDYAGLSPDVALHARAAAERIRVRIQRTTADIIAIGEELREIKARLPHGEFRAWLDAEFDMSESSAQRFMQVADAFGGKSVTVTDLNPSALYALAAPAAEPIREAAVARIAAGEVLSKADVDRMRREHADETAALQRAADEREGELKAQVADAEASAARAADQARTLKGQLDDLGAAVSAETAQALRDDVAEAQERAVRERVRADGLARDLEAERAKPPLTVEVPVEVSAPAPEPADLFRQQADVLALRHALAGILREHTTVPNALAGGDPDEWADQAGQLRGMALELRRVADLADAMADAVDPPGAEDGGREPGVGDGPAADDWAIPSGPRQYPTLNDSALDIPPFLRRSNAPE